MDQQTRPGLCILPQICIESFRKQTKRSFKDLWSLCVYSLLEMHQKRKETEQGMLQGRMHVSLLRYALKALENRQILQGCMCILLVRYIKSWRKQANPSSTYVYTPRQIHMRSLRKSINPSRTYVYIPPQICIKCTSGNKSILKGLICNSSLDMHWELKKIDLSFMDLCVFSSLDMY